MDVGAILSKSFNLYRRNLVLVIPQLTATAISFLLFIAFALITALILLSILGSLSVLSIMSVLQGPAPFLLITYLIFGALALLLAGMVLGALARAAVIGMVVEAEKAGKTTIGTGIESAKKHGLKIFGYTIAISLVPGIVMMFVGFILVFISVFVISAVDMSGSTDLLFLAFFLFFFLFFIISYAIIYALALFSPQKIVVEGHGIIDGIKASFGFVKKYPTEVVIYIGVAFAVMVMTSLVSMAFIIPRVVFEMMDSRFIVMFLQIFEFFFSIAVGLIVAPYLEAVKTLMVMEEDKKDEGGSTTPVL